LGEYTWLNWNIYSTWPSVGVLSASGAVTSSVRSGTLSRSEYVFPKTFWPPWSFPCLLYDNFVTDLPAGTVSGTNAEPGPGVRITSTGVSIVSGSLCMPYEVNLSTLIDTLCSFSGSFVRTAGRLFKAELEYKDTYLQYDGVFGFSSSNTSFGNVGCNFHLDNFSNRLYWANPTGTFITSFLLTNDV